MKVFDTAYRRTIAMLAVGVLLAACASDTKTADLDGDDMNADERRLAGYAGPNYTRQYAVQAGLVGAAAGAAIGCGIFAALGESCAQGAILGGAAGGLGGAVYGAEQGRKTEALAQRQMAASDAEAIAEEELRNARASRRAAKAVVAQQQRRLSRLRNDLATGRADQQEAEKTLAEARRAEVLIGASRDKLQDSIADVEQRIQSERSSGRSSRKLRETYRDLKEEERQLDRELAELKSHIIDTESRMQS